MIDSKSIRGSWWDKTQDTEDRGSEDRGGIKHSTQLLKEKCAHFKSV